MRKFLQEATTIMLIPFFVILLGIAAVTGFLISNFPFKDENWDTQ